MALLDLFKRSESGAPLTLTEFDANYTAIETAINQLDIVHPIRPEDYTAGSDDAKVFSALTDGITSNRQVCLDGTYTLSAPLSTINMISGTLSVAGNGKFYIPADLNTTPAITIHATYPAPVAVTAIVVESHTFPTGDAATTISTKITATGHGLVIGDIFKIVSDDLISNSPDADAFIGQFGHVADVSGASFWTGGRLYDTYTTNVRVVRVRKEPRLIWNGPGFSSNAGNVWDTLFLRILGFVQPRVRTWVRDGYSTGVDIKSCVQADVDIEILGLRNDVDTQSFGYGVRDTSSAYSTVKIRSIDSRHAYTSNTAAATANGEPYLYGRTLGAVVSGVAMGNSSSPFDTHSEGTDITFANCSTGNSYLGSASGGQSITLRGANNRAINCTDRNSVNGYSFTSEGVRKTSDCEFVACRYFGSGTPFRINASTSAGPIVRPRISGCFGQSLTATMLQAWDCEGGVIDGLRLVPTGASGQAILLSGNAQLTVRNLLVDLRDYTGSNNYRIFAFSSATTGNKLVVESAQVINAAGKLQAWASGGPTTGTISLAGLITDAVPSSGTLINGGSLDSFTLADSWIRIGVWDFAVSGAVGLVDFANLNFDEVRVVARGVTKATTGTINVRVSTNNGTSFNATSGDYVSIAADGTEALLTGVPMHDANATLARSGVATLSGLRTTEKKNIVAHNRGIISTIETVSVVNAIRVMPSAGGNFTGGTITALGRS